MLLSADFERLSSFVSLAALAVQVKVYNVSLHLLNSLYPDINHRLGHMGTCLCRLCPNCKLKEFPSIEALILHLNSQSTCWPPEVRPQELPVPPIFRRGPVSSTTGTCHPNSRYVFGVGKNMLDRLEDDEYAYRRKINRYYPFHDEGEWELGKFLVENLTQTQITKFLKLKWVSRIVQVIGTTLIVNSLTITQDHLSPRKINSWTGWTHSLVLQSGKSPI
jgi:hypothetical protein